MNETTKTMIKKAHEALALSYSPYSKFTVASCICTDKDNLYTGANIENGSYSLSICAESSALCSMIMAGEQRIKSIVILAGNNLLCPPCGACRQRIHEFSTKDTVVHLCNEHSILKSLTIGELLPFAFVFDH